ncbi:hypothetical protein A3Q56_01545 [Intoshia linei]|uniref:Minor histocompatibility antigen H13 n=1 Tax=Intoshia linei TaxID=1819745 RepID=A0A177B8X2_9BILA|nr:hypothetical protein A3Q56_01545 [Intoshia linei]
MSENYDLNSIASKVTETFTNTTKNVTEHKVDLVSQLFAFSGIISLSLLTIYVGSTLSAIYRRSLMKSNFKDKQYDIITRKDAALFPFIASFVLVSFYVVFKFMNKDDVSKLIRLYFGIFGIYSITKVITPLFEKLLFFINVRKFNLCLTEFKDKENKKNYFSHDFNTHFIITVIFSIVNSAIYIFYTNWISNNIFAVCFCINALEFLFINKFLNGVLLMSGLFFYDIYWVFYTEVMVVVGKSLQVPIKIMIPQNINFSGNVTGELKHSMLGLGDIVIPGLMIAFLCRFDSHHNRKYRPYFLISFLTYFLGLVAAFLAMVMYKHAQPALLYLVPCGLLTPLFTALARGELKQLLDYVDKPNDMGNNSNDDSNEHDKVRNDAILGKSEKVE